jgi:hypothetical protein
MSADLARGVVGDGMGGACRFYKLILSINRRTAQDPEGGLAANQGGFAGVG